MSRPNIFYGYIIAAAGFVIQALSFGMLNTFGVFFNPLLDEFGWPRATLSVASSLAFLMFGLFGILAGKLGDRIDPRRVMMVFGALLGAGYILMSQVNATGQLYVFYGLMVGIGLGAMDVIPLSTIARWFITKRGKMSGLIKLGSGLGMLVMPLVAVRLIATYSWRLSYIILGVIVLAVTIWLAQFLARDPSQKGLSPLGDKTEANQDMPVDVVWSFGRLLRTKQFAMLSALYALTLFSSRTLQVHVAPYALDLGMTPANGAAILATFGAVGMAGRIVMGIVSDRIGNRLSLVICSCVLVFSFIWLQGAKELLMLLVFAAALGFSHGGFFTILSPLVADMFGIGSHGMNFGIVMFSGTVGGAIGPIIAGRMFDASGSYRLPFLVCTIASAGVLALALTLKQTGRGDSGVYYVP